MNERDGSIRWHTAITGSTAKLALNGGIIESIADDLCFDGCSRGASVAAINASTGALLWDQEITEAYHLSPPQFVKGTL